LAFDPKDPTTLAVSTNRRMVFWDTAGMKEKFSLPGKEVGGAALVFSPDGQTVAWGDGQGNIDLWDVAQRKVIRQLQGHQNFPRHLAFSADGKTLVSTAWGEDALRLWDVSAGQELTQRRADVMGKQLSAFAASADGKTVLTGSTGGIVKVWDLALLRGGRAGR
jgi:WD40 repeat protein